MTIGGLGGRQQRGEARDLCVEDRDFKRGGSFGKGERKRERGGGGESVICKVKELSKSSEKN
jgi:hypothetical protein